LDDREESVEAEGVEEGTLTSVADKKAKGERYGVSVNFRL